MTENIKFHDDMDLAFKPLFEHLGAVYHSEKDVYNTVDQYMYMFHDDDKTYYKHFGNREYFNINNDGETEGKLQNWRDWS